MHVPKYFSTLYIGTITEIKGSFIIFYTNPFLNYHFTKNVSKSTPLGSATNIKITLIAEIIINTALLLFQHISDVTSPNTMNSIKSNNLYVLLNSFTNNKKPEQLIPNNEYLKR